MKSIKITVTGNEARAEEKPVLTSGTVGQPVEFSFDEAWNDLARTAVFKAGGREVPVSCLQQAEVVPWEVMERPNVELFIGVYGTDGNGNKTIPTIWVSAGIIRPGTQIPDTVPQEPTPQVYDQILAAANEAVKTANSVRKDADNGVFDGHTPEKGVDYWTPEDQTQMVAAVLAALPTYKGEVEAV